MVETITPQEFQAAVGAKGWRVLARGAGAYFSTPSFDRGVELVNEIAKLAAAQNHHPDIDLRYSSVTVRLITHEVGGLSERDAELAQKISLSAETFGLLADPTRVEDVQVAIDAVDIPTVRAFWRAVLNYRDEGDEDLLDPEARGPSLWFQQMDAPRTERNCIHIDVYVPHDEAHARVASAIAASGRLVTDEFAPSWWVLADPEGNEACVATWMDRE
jgi:4a-hydroxytetrahydrobiopterin dehydratase